MNMIANNAAGDKYSVVGKWNSRTGFTPYENRHFGQAAVNEVVLHNSGYARTYLDERGKMRLWDVTEDVAGLKTFGFGDELVDRFVEAL